MQGAPAERPGAASRHRLEGLDALPARPRPQGVNRRGAGVLSVALTLFTAGALTLGQTRAAVAQDVTLIDAQRRLNEEAVAAVESGDFERAELLLRSSLELQDLNITWLNLGRIYQKMGRCQDAHQAYQRALEAPEAEGVPAEVLAQRVDQWSQELQETCPGTLQIDCEDPRTTVTVNEQTAQCGDALSLPPGEHTVIGRLDGGQHLHTARLKALETLRLTLAPKPAPPTASTSHHLDPEIEQEAGTTPQDNALLQWVGWGLMGAGVTVIALGGVVYASGDDELAELEAMANAPTGDRARYDVLKSAVEQADTTATVMWVGGGLLLAACGALLFWEW